MKMLITILNDEDSGHVYEALHKADFPVTRIASTGGFLRQGNSTLMIGADDARVDEAVEIIYSRCFPSIEPFARRAIVFVLNVEQFEQY
ncbi:MAG: transcriptional regulator [Chloroflexi bacterium]|nr:transcriptional regulator [Chloroflexota bacterium]